MKRKKRVWKQNKAREAQFFQLKALGKAYIRKVRVTLGAQLRERDRYVRAVSLPPLGFSSPLQWLQNCLLRVADDREEDGEWTSENLRVRAQRVAGLGRRSKSSFVSCVT